MSGWSVGVAATRPIFWALSGITDKIFSLVKKRNFSERALNEQNAHFEGQPLATSTMKIFGKALSADVKMELAGIGQLITFGIAV